MKQSHEKFLKDFRRESMKSARQKSLEEIAAEFSDQNVKNLDVNPRKRNPKYSGGISEYREKFTKKSRKELQMTSRKVSRDESLKKFRKKYLKKSRDKSREESLKGSLMEQSKESGKKSRRKTGISSQRNPRENQ